MMKKLNHSLHKLACLFCFIDAAHAAVVDRYGEHGSYDNVNGGDAYASASSFDVTNEAYATGGDGYSCYESNVPCIEAGNGGEGHASALSVGFGNVAAKVIQTGGSGGTYNEFQKKGGNGANSYALNAARGISYEGKLDLFQWAIGGGGFNQGDAMSFLSSSGSATVVALSRADGYHALADGQISARDSAQVTVEASGYLANLGTVFAEAQFGANAIGIVRQGFASDYRLIDAVDGTANHVVQLGQEVYSNFENGYAESYLTKERSIDFLDVETYAEANHGSAAYSDASNLIGASRAVAEAHVDGPMIDGRAEAIAHAKGGAGLDESEALSQAVIGSASGFADATSEIKEVGIKVFSSIEAQSSHYNVSQVTSVITDRPLSDYISNSRINLLGNLDLVSEQVQSLSTLVSNNKGSDLLLPNGVDFIGEGEMVLLGNGSPLHENSKFSTRVDISFSQPLAIDQKLMLGFQAHSYSSIFGSSLLGLTVFKDNNVFFSQQFETIDASVNFLQDSILDLKLPTYTSLDESSLANTSDIGIQLDYIGTGDASFDLRFVLAILSGKVSSTLNTESNNYFSQLSLEHNLSQPVTVSVPSAVWMLGSGLLSLAGFNRRKIRQTTAYSG